MTYYKNIPKDKVFGDIFVPTPGAGCRHCRLVQGIKTNPNPTIVGGSSDFGCRHPIIGGGNLPLVQGIKTNPNPTIV